MPKGIYLCKEIGELIYYEHVVLRIAYDEIFEKSLHSNSTIISRDTVRKICKHLDDATGEQIQNFLAGPMPHSGGGVTKMKLEPLEQEFIMDLYEHNAHIRLSQATDIFLETFFKLISCKIVWKTLHKHGWTRKVVTSRNMLIDHEERILFLKRMSRINPYLIIDIDESNVSPDRFFDRYGWSPEGEEALRIQITIGGKAYTVIAAYTPLGFISWEIFEGPVTHNEFKHFIETNVAPLVNEDSIGLLDNASIHKTVDVFTALNTIFQGGFMFSPPYSCDLKPIELGFSNVKHWLCENEEDAARDPIGAINHAFYRYSIYSEPGITAGV